MKLNEYLEQVQRTLPNLDDTYSIGEVTANIKLPTELLNTLHVRAGIFSEINELMEAIISGDRVNILEELTDMLWYISNDLNIKFRRGYLTEHEYAAYKVYEFKLVIVETSGAWMHDTTGVAGWYNAIVYNASRLANLVKRDLAYRKEESKEEYIQVTNHLLGAINNLAFELGLSLEEGMESNIAKLRKRFPDKFTEDKALNRDLAGEREILEGKNVSSNDGTIGDTI